MSSTRRADPSDPLNFEKYMSAPEFVAIRPLPGNAVLMKASLYSDPKVKELAYFLQAMSMQPGGLEAAANQIVQWYPERCREEDSREASMLKLADLLFDASAGATGEKLSLPERTSRLLGDFLIDLAINPKLNLSHIECPCFDGLGEALQQFRAAHEKSVWNGFVTTTAGVQIHETLTQSLEMARMVVIEGPAGGGKSTNTAAWCDAHPGQVRRISLTGITSRTLFFQKIAASIGLATCQKKAFELQLKIEDFFARSRVMLVIDEAHYLWPQAVRPEASPDLIDWIDTALVNQGVPVALICTDQFAKLKSRVERHVGWTSEQFIHRVFRYRKLPELPTAEDVEKVTKARLSSMWDKARQQWIPCNRDCNNEAVRVLTLYAMDQKIPLSCVSSCIDEARNFALKSGRSFVSNQDLRKALFSGQVPSDAALVRAFSLQPAQRRGRRSENVAAAPAKPNRAYVSETAEASPVRARESSNQDVLTA